MQPFIITKPSSFKRFYFLLSLFENECFSFVYKSEQYPDYRRKLWSGKPSNHFCSRRFGNCSNYECWTCLYISHPWMCVCVRYSYNNSWQINLFSNDELVLMLWWFNSTLKLEEQDNKMIIKRDSAESVCDSENTVDIQPTFYRNGNAKLSQNPIWKKHVAL